MDKYDGFSSLKINESEYFIEICDRDSPVTILAPHGGQIEPHTSDIAKLIAGSSYNCFCFNGEKQHGNQDLHITSHRYDEEQALALLQKSKTVIAIHGCREEKSMIYLGGLNHYLRQEIATHLARWSIPHLQCPASWPLSGTSPNNICNQGTTGKGVQLEISRGLRDLASAWDDIAAAVRSAIGDK